MQNTISLRLNKDFRRLYGRGKSLVSPTVVIYLMKNRFGKNRLGITVNKKNGGAVLRNRVRRILKEAYRHLEPNIKLGYDFVLVARGKTAFCKSTDVEKALYKLLNDKGFIIGN
jgi:ribonuclease P protein component